MKDFKNQLKVWIYAVQHLFIWFLLALVIMPLLMMAILYFCNEPGAANQTSNIDLIYIVYIWLICFGGVYSTKFFLITMSIRANRKSYIAAMGIMSVGTGILFGTTYYMVCEGSTLISQKIERLQGLQVIGNNTWIKMVTISIVLVLLGGMLGSFYHRLSKGMFFTGAFVLLALALYSRVDGENGRLISVGYLMIEKLQDQLLLAIGVGSLAFLVTAFNLKGCSLKGSAGKVKKKRGRKIHEGA